MTQNLQRNKNEKRKKEREIIIKKERSKNRTKFIKKEVLFLNFFSPKKKKCARRE